MKEYRLFVPLTTPNFEDFRDRGKTVEIRKRSDNFTRRTVYEGRLVEFRCGYSGQSLWGVILSVVEGSLEGIFKRYPLEKIEPRCSTVVEAINRNNTWLYHGTTPPFIAFESTFDPNAQRLQPTLL